MGGSDILICLLEHEPEAAGTALFRRQGIPRLRADRFSPQSMQRALPGMAGTQHFFQVDGRPFCLYVGGGQLDHPRPARARRGPGRPDPSPRRSRSLRVSPRAGSVPTIDPR